MCRNIRPLYNFEPPATAEEIQAASLQFVRKVSGMQKPAKINQNAFEDAVREVSRVIEELFAALQTHAPARDREIEAEKARARARNRYAR
ncbi:MAG: DUF2277 domain-containing protein [Thermomicrobiales bacterium]